MRMMRRNTPLRDQAAASRDIAHLLASLPMFSKAGRIAAYLPFDGEVDTRPLITIALHAGKDVYLPVLTHHGRSMKFAAYEPDMRMVLNRYGIPEPAPETRNFVAVQKLDLVLTPLVAFDRSLNRLGLGAGYYDRCFSFLKRRKNWEKPRLVGLAYEFQRLESINTADWDVPLHVAVTENNVYSASDEQKRG